MGDQLGRPPASPPASSSQESVRPDLIHCLMFGLMSKPLHDSHLHHPPCAHWQAQHRALPLERHRGRVEDVTDKTRRGVPHSQDVPGRGSK